MGLIRWFQPFSCEARVHCGFFFRVQFLTAIVPCPVDSSSLQMVGDEAADRPSNEGQQQSNQDPSQAANKEANRNTKAVLHCSWLHQHLWYSRRYRYRGRSRLEQVVIYFHFLLLLFFVLFSGGGGVAFCFVLFLGCCFLCGF